MSAAPQTRPRVRPSSLARVSLLVHMCDSFVFFPSSHYCFIYTLLEVNFIIVVFWKQNLQWGCGRVWEVGVSSGRQLQGRCGPSG